MDEDFAARLDLAACGWLLGANEAAALYFEVEASIGGLLHNLPDGHADERWNFDHLARCDATGWK